VPLGGHVAALDSPRQLDLLLGVEQLDPPDRAQIEPQRVEARLDREIELGLLRSAGLRLRLLVGGDAVLGEDVDPVLDQVGVEVANLLLGDLDLLSTSSRVAAICSKVR
jgi:hypothetical protein